MGLIFATLGEHEEAVSNHILDQLHSPIITQLNSSQIYKIYVVSVIQKSRKIGSIFCGSIFSKRCIPLFIGRI